MNRDPRFEATQPREAMREVVIAPLEMLAIAETAQECVDFALQHDWAVVSDRSLYNGIPHRNDLRSPDFRLALRDSMFGSIDINLPRKDEDVRIQITAHAQDLPNRTVALREFTHVDEDGQRKFFVDDSQGVAFARSTGGAIDSLMTQTEVASWLYLQAGLSAPAAQRKLRSESDPVRNACDLLSARATQHYTIREVKIPFSPDLEMHGQLVEAIDTKNPLAKPLVRKYSAWVTNHHSIDGHAVTERLFVEFSPEDYLLGHPESPMSRTSVMLESSHPSYNVGKAIVNQAISYENGGVQDTFAVIRDRLSNMYQSPTV